MGSLLPALGRCFPSPQHRKAGKNPPGAWDEVVCASVLFQCPCWCLSLCTLQVQLLPQELFPEENIFPPVLGPFLTIPGKHWGLTSALGRRAALKPSQQQLLCSLEMWDLRMHFDLRAGHPDNTPRQVWGLLYKANCPELFLIPPSKNSCCSSGQEWTPG